MRVSVKSQKSEVKVNQRRNYSIWRWNFLVRSIRYHEKKEISLYRNGRTPEVTELRSLERQNKRWTSSTEALIRLKNRHGLPHRPRTADEIGMIQVGKMEEIVDVLWAAVDSFRAVASQPSTWVRFAF